MSSITRIRKKRSERWYTVDIPLYELEASVLSIEAKLFHLYLSSRPDNWRYNRVHAAKIMGSEYKIDKACAELKKIGLLKIIPIKQGNRFCGFDWVIASSLDDINLPDPETEDPEYQDPEIEDPDIQETLKENTIRKERTELKERSIVHQAAHAHDPNQLSLFSDQEFEAELRRRTGNDSLSISKGIDSERSDLPAAACGKVDKSGKKILPRGGHAPDAFAAFWEQHPIKKGKLAAQAAWNRLKANSELIDTIMHDMSNRKQNDRQWVEGFAPHPATYLNGARWTDEIEPLTNKKTGVQSKQADNSDGSDELWAIMRGES